MNTHTYCLNVYCNRCTIILWQSIIFHGYIEVRKRLVHKALQSIFITRLTDTFCRQFVDDVVFLKHSHFVLLSNKYTNCLLFYCIVLGWSRTIRYTGWFQLLFNLNEKTSWNTFNSIQMSVRLQWKCVRVWCLKHMTISCKTVKMAFSMAWFFIDPSKILWFVYDSMHLLVCTNIIRIQFILICCCVQFSLDSMVLPKKYCAWNRRWRFIETIRHGTWQYVDDKINIVLIRSTIVSVTYRMIINWYWIHWINSFLMWFSFSAA